MQKSIHSLEFGDKTEITLLTKIVQKVVQMTNADHCTVSNDNNAQIEQIDQNRTDRAFCINSVEFDNIEDKIWF